MAQLRSKIRYYVKDIIQRILMSFQDCEINNSLEKKWPYINLAQSRNSLNRTKTQAYSQIDMDYNYNPHLFESLKILTYQNDN